MKKDENVALERKRLGLDQKAVYEKLGVSKGTYQRWEKGYAIPSNHLKELDKLGFDIYFIVTNGRQEIDVDILKETLKVMLPVLPAMGDDLEVKTKMVGITYNTLLEEQVKKTKASLNIPTDMDEADSASQTIEGKRNIQSSDGKVNQSIKGDGNKQTFKAK